MKGGKTMNRYKCPACGGNQYSASPNREQEACIYCDNKGTELMKDINPENDPDIKKLTKEQVSSILNAGFETGKYKPIGRFYTKEGELYIGIDNSTGDAWTEEFKTKASCFKWLEGERARDAHGQWMN